MDASDSLLNLTQEGAGGMSERAEWIVEARKLYELDPNKFNYTALAEKYNKTPKYIGNAFSRLKKRKNQEPTKKENPININESVLKLTEKEIEYDVICEKVGISERQLAATIEDLKNSGFCFDESELTIKLSKEIVINNPIHKENWNGEKVIRFGLVSDTHLCSKTQQLTHLNSMYDIFQREGITTVYHSGDIVDGDDVYPGHRFEVFKVGADDQKTYAVENYPKRNGITTKFIGGNHDLKWFVKDGYDVCKSIAAERSDIVYLGQYIARVELTNNCILQLEHPLGKPAYAVSYKTQRKIDNMRGGEKPSILAEGHYHYHNNLFRRNVHAFCVPSFQGPNNLSTRLGLENDNGAFIIEVRVDEEGTVQRLISEFFAFYKVIKNDY